MLNTFKAVECDSNQLDDMEQLREKFDDLWNTIKKLCPQGRECSLAFTKLEECAMWANKSIAHKNLEK